MLTTGTQHHHRNAVGLVDVMATDALPRGRAGVRSIADIERRAVERTGQTEAAQSPFAQRCVGVRTAVVERVERARDPADHDAVGPDLFEAAELSVRQIAQITEFDSVSVSHGALPSQRPARELLRSAAMDR